MLHTLPDEARHKLLPLLARDYPSKPFLLAYLQGRIPGITYVDNLQAPTFCLVVTEFHHTAFLGWTSPHFDLSAALKEALIEEDYLYLVWSKDFPLNEPDLPMFRLGRLEFRTLDDQKFQGARASVASTATASPIDEGNFDVLPCKDELLAAYEVKENFLKHSFGIALTEEACVTDATALFVADDGDTRYGEIQIATADHAQRKGHGLKAAVLLIDEMKQRGMAPVWSCNKGNAPSEGLARKLGFVQTLEYDIFCFESPPQLTRFWVSVLDKFGATYEKKDAAIAHLRTEYLMTRQLAHGVFMRYINLKDRNGSQDV